MQTSKRAAAVDSSGIRRVFELAAKLKDPINLSIGQADFQPWTECIEGAKEALEQGRNGYTITQGIPELREKIRQAHGYQAEGDYSEIVTSGVSGGLLLAYMAVLDPGDEVLIPDPFFCIYRDAAKLINAEPVYYDTYPDFSLQIERIEKAFTPRTKAIVVSSPANPTGYAMSQSELDTVIEFARAKNIWLIYDEIYSCFALDRPHAQAFGKYEGTIVLNGFSKSHGAAGWRIGYALGPKSVIQEMAKMQQYTFVCAPVMAQWGILKGFTTDFSEKLVAYRKKRDFMYEALKNDYEVVKPGGAFYFFPKAPGGSSKKFVEKCIEHSLLVVPGEVFSRADTHFRLSYSAPMRDLERGAEVLKKLAINSVCH